MSKEEILTMNSPQVRAILEARARAMSEAQYLNWIASQITGDENYLKSEPPSGKRKVKNLYVDETGRLVVQFDDQPA